MMRLDETFIPFANPTDQMEKGLAHCRQGDWKEGLEQLRVAAERMPSLETKPSRYYSYLGYGIALKEKRVREGIKLCRFAIREEFYQPENYVNLARTYLLAGDRRRACKTVLKGLDVDAEFPELLQLQKKLGARRPPIIPFLSRTNVFNQILGKMRHSMKPAKKEKVAETKGPAKKEKAAKTSRPT
jgi:tetratricopeptide (TPR) repeat protein